MPLVEDIVSVTISIADKSVTQAGFTTPMIVGPTQAFTPLVTKSYSAGTALASMIADGFTVDAPEYRAMAAIVSQTARPPTIKVGRRAADHIGIQSVKYTPINVVAGKVYTITINGTEFSATADATPTAGEVATALHGAINAGAEPVTSTDGTGYITLADDVAGAHNAIKGSVDFTVDDLTSDDGTATELALILADDKDWYGLVLASCSTAEKLIAADWAEDNKKLFIACSADSDIIGSGASMAITMETAGYNYAGSLFSRSACDFPEASWMGSCLSFTPGSLTWMFKALAGQSVDTITATDKTNLDAATCNYYAETGGVDMTFNGWASSGRYFDITVFADWLKARIEEEIFSLLVNSQKVPYTKGGIAQIQGVVESVLRRGVRAGGLAEDPRPEVIVPDIADISTVDKAARILPDIQFFGTLTGAIHGVELIGTISL